MRYSLVCISTALDRRIILVVTAYSYGFCGYKQGFFRIFMRYPLLCISKALYRGIILVATAKSYGLLWL